NKYKTSRRTLKGVLPNIQFQMVCDRPSAAFAGSPPHGGDASEASERGALTHHLELQSSNTPLRLGWTRSVPRTIRSSYWGSAKTYMAFAPLDVSASGVRPTPIAIIGPPPAAMAMYWRPLIEYVTAPPAACEGRRVCHKT